jgi:beta-glucanase (GH16 family)
MDYSAWPFSGPQYLLLNVAVGGSLGGEVDGLAFPASMEVEFVRVYQKSAVTPSPAPIVEWPPAPVPEEPQSGA